VFAENTSYFDGLVNLVPARYYVALTDSEAADTYARFLKNKSGKTPKQEIKERTKKAKKLRLDPAAAAVPTTEVLREHEEKAQREIDTALAGDEAASDSIDQADGDDTEERARKRLLGARCAKMCALECRSLMHRVGSAMQQ
jgi:hypothetical protein